MTEDLRLIGPACETGNRDERAGPGTIGPWSDGAAAFRPREAQTAAADNLTFLEQ